jgi:hypothetical protein
MPDHSVEVNAINSNAAAVTATDLIHLVSSRPRSHKAATLPPLLDTPNYRDPNTCTFTTPGRMVAAKYIMFSQKDIKEKESDLYWSN